MNQRRWNSPVKAIKQGIGEAQRKKIGGGGTPFSWGCVS